MIHGTLHPRRLQRRRSWPNLRRLPVSANVLATRWTASVVSAVMMAHDRQNRFEMYDDPDLALYEHVVPDVAMVVSGFAAVAAVNVSAVNSSDRQSVMKPEILSK